MRAPSSPSENQSRQNNDSSSREPLYWAVECISFDWVPTGFPDQMFDLLMGYAKCLLCLGRQYWSNTIAADQRGLAQIRRIKKGTRIKL